MDDQNTEILALLDEILSVTHECLAKTRHMSETLDRINQTCEAMLVDGERFRREMRELRLQRHRIDRRHEIDSDLKPSH